MVSPYHPVEGLGDDAPEITCYYAGDELPGKLPSPPLVKDVHYPAIKSLTLLPQLKNEANVCDILH